MEISETVQSPEINVHMFGLLAFLKKVQNFFYSFFSKGKEYSFQ